MDWLDLKNKGVKELYELQDELREKLRKLRFETRALKQVHQIGEARKTIARIATLLKQKER